MSRLMAYHSGSYAVIIKSANRENIGVVVRLIRPRDGSRWEIKSYGDVIDNVGDRINGFGTASPDNLLPLCDEARAFIKRGWIHYDVIPTVSLKYWLDHQLNYPDVDIYSRTGRYYRNVKSGEY